MEELNGLVMQKLDKLNKGFNFFNIVQTEKKFYIEVELKVTQDLKSKEEVINVKTNLDIPNGSHSGYWGNYDVVDFLADLEKFCESPFAEIRTTNRKETLGHYELSDIRHKTRDKIINFSDIKITIGNLAKKKLEVLEIDFENQIKGILKKQKYIDKETQDKIDRYVFLREKMEILKSLVGYKEDYGYSYNNYGQPKDNTLKMTLSPQEYNDKLKEIETEIRKLEKFFGLKETEMKYVKIPEKIDYDKWLKDNEERLRDDYEENKEDDSITFDEYCEMCFEQDLDNGEVEESEEDCEE